ncbi:MAG: DUF3579 domain-containing protein [Pseudomonadota bacterium]|nr:DUF3579 domain-containing protein [Pseudomonadota bacterium]MDP1905684.1 DUF3579 domain-containing protein [Pseudomonadota bacterium]MDP2353556.1 DUF3579 domain-containing protein [Pseudomonadota bacterium]
MPDEFIGEIVIRGVTRQGKTFRPSDWATRLAGVESQVGHDHRQRYSPAVQPVTRAGVSCVVIDRRLAALDAGVLKFLMDFASENDLEVSEGRQEAR